MFMVNKDCHYSEERSKVPEPAEQSMRQLNEYMSEIIKAPVKPPSH